MGPLCVPCPRASPSLAEPQDHLLGAAKKPESVLGRSGEGRARSSRSMAVGIPATRARPALHSGSPSSRPREHGPGQSGNLVL